GRGAAGVQQRQEPVAVRRLPLQPRFGAGGAGGDRRRFALRRRWQGDLRGADRQGEAVRGDEARPGGDPEEEGQVRHGRQVRREVLRGHVQAVRRRPAVREADAEGGRGRGGDGELLLGQGWGEIRGEGQGGRAEALDRVHDRAAADGAGIQGDAVHGQRQGDGGDVEAGEPGVGVLRGARGVKEE